MKSSSSPYRALAVAACFVFGLLSACDNTVDPFVDAVRQPFAVFGYLDTGADTQFVRVENLQEEAALSGSVGRQPTVTLVNLDLDRRTVWDDSVVVLDDGSRALIYYSTMNILPAATYRMEVTSPGVAPTRTTTTVPASYGIQVAPPRQNVVGDVQQVVSWRGVRRLNDIHINYKARVLPTMADTTFRLPYLNFSQATTEAYRTTVMLDRDYRTIRQSVFDAFGDTTIVLLDLSMSIVVPSAEWSAQESGTNFENGSGFFGSVGRFTEGWSLDSTIARSIGYQVP